MEGPDCTRLPTTRKGQLSPGSTTSAWWWGGTPGPQNMLARISENIQTKFKAILKIIIFTDVAFQNNFNLVSIFKTN